MKSICLGTEDALTARSFQRKREDMLKKGFTLVEVMVVVAIISLLASIAIPNLLRARISANDAVAKATLRAISSAAEMYATTNSGNYPGDIASMTNVTPPYLNKNYCSQTISGYTYTCAFGTSAYSVTATPSAIRTSGTTTFTITTGGILSPS